MILLLRLRFFIHPALIFPGVARSLEKLQGQPSAQVCLLITEILLGPILFGQVEVQQKGLSMMIVIVEHPNPSQQKIVSELMANPVITIRTVVENPGRFAMLPHLKYPNSSGFS